MNQRQIDLKHASLGHLFVLIWVEFTPSKSSFELIDAGPLSLFCNVLKICLRYIWIVDHISYSGAFFFSFQHRRHYLSSKKELKKKKKERRVLVFCYYSNSYTHNVNYTDVFHGGGLFIGQMGGIQKCVLMINNQSSQLVSGWPLPFP